MAPGPALLGAFLVLAIVIGVGSFLFGFGTPATTADTLSQL